MRFKILALFGSALILPLTAANAIPRTQSGTFGGTTWNAASRIVGAQSTATIAGGGNPTYLAPEQRYRGTVGLLMDYGAGGAFVCSGSLASDRQSIITAAHCVSDGTSARPNSVTAYFYNGDPSDNPVYSAGAIGVTTVGTRSIHVNPLYTGEIIDQNDIAVLRLDGTAPSFAIGYDLFTPNDLTGQQFNIAGYGGRSDGGGAVGVNLGTGRLREGDNRFDFRLGDSAFDGFFDGGPNGFFGTADTRFSYIADFDNGLSVNDGSCRLAVEGFGIAPSAQFCNLGLGIREATSAGGDSGGPQFINGQLAALTSYGLSFGRDFGDIDDNLNDTFGEFGGYVPIFLHTAFIAGVPEPATWAMMIGGFGLVGGAARRRRVAAVAA